MPANPRIAIDATNMLGGGGLTHLMELLSAADPARHGFSQIVVWGSPDTLAQLPDKPWLKKNIQGPRITRTLLRRSLWQLMRISKAARGEGCDILFIPGGSFFGRFRPFVAMSQNMLPFERKERARYGFSLKAIRLLLLSMTQYLTFLRADSVISLSQHGKNVIQQTKFLNSENISVISHGVNQRFYQEPRPQQAISTFSDDNPFRLVYISPIEPYKHHEEVIIAVAALRRKFSWPLQLTLAGPATAKGSRMLAGAIARHDPAGKWISFKGFIPFDRIDTIVKQADIGIFASSCEACPNIVIEYMAAGLPIASSHDGPMPEVLEGGAVYFDPERPAAIEAALANLIQFPDIRAGTAAIAYQRAHDLTWAVCADKTFSVLARAAHGRTRSEGSATPE